MFSYFIDYNRNRFEEKTFMDLVEITRLISEWNSSQTVKLLSQIEKIIYKNRKLQDLLKKNINVRNYSKLYFAKKYINTEDVPEIDDTLRREEAQVYSWTHSEDFAVKVSDYISGHKKPKTGGVVAVAKGVKPEDVLVDVYKLLVFIEEIFSEVDETDIKTFLKKTQGAEYNKDTVSDLLHSYHRLEDFAKNEQEVIVNGTTKNNKCSVVAYYKHADGVFEENGWQKLVNFNNYK